MFGNYAKAGGMMYFDFEKLKADGRYIQFCLDFIVREDVCNLRCDYCLNKYAALDENHSFRKDTGSLDSRAEQAQGLVYGEGYGLKENIDRVLKEYQDTFDAPVIKFSGGEILLVKNITGLLEEQARNYEVVQLLTNGILLDRDFISRIKGIPNIHIQLSLDGHTLEMNYNRVKTGTLNKRLLDGLDLLVSSGIITEIFCVVTKTNIEGLPQFAEYLLENYGGKVKLFPFPVRQGAAGEFLPGPDELGGLESIVKNHERYECLLPPLPYMEELYSYIKNRRRRDKCYISLVSCQIFDGGTFTPCPNCWTVSFGNLGCSRGEVLDNLGKHRIYQLMLNDPPVAPFCKKCFSELDLVNMYFNGRLTLEDLSASRQLFKGPRVRKSLMELKRIFDQTDFEEFSIRKKVQAEN